MKKILLLVLVSVVLFLGGCSRNNYFYINKTESFKNGATYTVKSLDEYNSFVESVGFNKEIKKYNERYFKKSAIVIFQIMIGIDYKISKTYTVFEGNKMAFNFEKQLPGKLRGVSPAYSNVTIIVECKQKELDGISIIELYEDGVLRFVNGESAKESE